MKQDQTLREKWNMKRRLVKVLIRKGGGDEEAVGFFVRLEGGGDVEPRREASQD